MSRHCDCRSKGIGLRVGKTSNYICQHNSFYYNRQELMHTWDWEMNQGLDPKLMGLGSRTKVWWKGDCGHRWKASLNHRSEGRDCPYCFSNSIPIERSIGFTHPDLAKELDLDQQQLRRSLSPKATKKVYWMCHCGTRWAASPVDRIQKYLACPNCDGRGDEQVIEEILAHFDPK